MKPILVTGASGYGGRKPSPKLLEKGHSVRCLARDPRKLSGAAGATAWKSSRATSWIALR